MTEIGLAEIVSPGFAGQLSTEIDRVLTRLARKLIVPGQGGAIGQSKNLGEVKPRLMAMIGPNPADFVPLRGTYAKLALATGAAGDTKAEQDPGLGNSPPHTIAEFADKAASMVEPWDGDAAKAFDDFIHWFTPEGASVKTLRLAIDHLNLTTEAYQQIYTNSRTDLWNLVQAVDAAMDTSEDLSSTQVIIALTVIAAIATAGVASVGAAATAIFGNAIIAAAASSASIIGGTVAQPKKAEIDPSDEQTIRDSLLDTVTRMEADLADTEELVRQALVGIANALSPFDEAGLKVLGPPVTGGQGTPWPIEWDNNGKGTLSQSYVDRFLPPSLTE